MQSFLQQLLNWAASNDMVVNFNKTKEMIMVPLLRLLTYSRSVQKLVPLNKLIRLNY